MHAVKRADIHIIFLSTLEVFEDCALRLDSAVISAVIFTTANIQSGRRPSLRHPVQES